MRPSTDIGERRVTKVVNVECFVDRYPAASATLLDVPNGEPKQGWHFPIFSHLLVQGKACKDRLCGAAHATLLPGKIPQRRAAERTFTILVKVGNLLGSDLAGMPTQRIILTGASSGIGAILAVEYAKQCCKLLLVARRKDRLESVAAQVAAAGGEAIILAADVTEPETAATAVDLAVQAWGGVDLVIANAGTSSPQWFNSFDAADAEQTMRVNWFSLVRMVQVVIPLFRRQGGGTFVAISSLAGYRGMPGSGPYNASKAAVTTLMQSLRTEVVGTPIRLLTISPGFIRTPMTDKNEFPMPFLMEPEQGARRIMAAIAKGKSEYRFPARLSAAVRLLQWMPNWLFDRLMNKLRPNPRDASPSVAEPNARRRR